MQGPFQGPCRSPCVHSLPLSGGCVGVGKEVELWLEQLRPSGVQPAAGPSRPELGMTSSRNLDCEPQSVYFPRCRGSSAIEP